MKQRRRIYYSAAERAEIWDRWQAGESMSSIGRRFDRESSSVFSVISPTGGIRPATRRHASQALSLGEREEISRGLSAHCSLRRIAGLLGRSPVHDRSRDPPQWQARPLSSRAFRPGGLGSSLAYKAVQAGLPTLPGPDSIQQAAAQMVAREDRRLAQARLPWGAA